MKPTERLSGRATRASASFPQSETATAPDLATVIDADDAMRSRLRQVEAENRELRRANEILRRAALHFALPASRER